MAYINANEVKAIRETLKVRFPGFKFAVRKGAGSLSVDVTIKQGPVDFMGARVANTSRETEKYLPVNQYWFHEHFAGEAKDMLTEVFDIIKTAPAKASGRAWFDESDAMTDYFHTAYYIHLSVGEWDRPYALVK